MVHQELDITLPFFLEHRYFFPIMCCFCVDAIRGEVACCGQVQFSKFCRKALENLRSDNSTAILHASSRGSPKEQIQNVVVFPGQSRVLPLVLWTFVPSKLVVDFFHAPKNWKN